jgi:hypothetical protein
MTICGAVAGAEEPAVGEAVRGAAVAVAVAVEALALLAPGLPPPPQAVAAATISHIAPRNKKSRRFWILDRTRDTDIF